MALASLDPRARSLGCRQEQQDRDSAPHELVSFLHRQACPSDVLFAVGAEWELLEIKGKEQNLGLAEEGCGVLAGWHRGNLGC